MNRVRMPSGVRVIILLLLLVSSFLAMQVLRQTSDNSVCVLQLPIPDTTMEYLQTAIARDDNILDNAGAHQPIVRIIERGKVTAEFPLLFTISSNIQITVHWIPTFEKGAALELNQLGEDKARFLYVLGDANASEIVSWEGKTFLAPIRDRQMGGFPVTGHDSNGNPVSNGMVLTPTPNGFASKARQRLGVILKEGARMIVQK